jgi:cytochrome c oxidase assembly factor CtaG
MNGKLTASMPRVLPTRTRNSSRRGIDSCIGLLICTDASAHTGSAQSWWSFDPWVGGGFALLLLLRPRRPATFLLAVTALFFALIWPLDALAETSFAAHMVQHMLLIGVAAPLLVFSRPSFEWVKALSHGAKRLVARLLRGSSALSRPSIAFALHAAAVWIGHSPRVIEAMVLQRWAHILGHAVLLATALIFWWSLRSRGRAGAGNAALWTLATMVHTGILGALLTFAPHTLYPAYSLADQQLAGLIMWVPGTLCYLAAGLVFAAAWFGDERRPA